MKIINHDLTNPSHEPPTLKHHHLLLYDFTWLLWRTVRKKIKEKRRQRSQEVHEAVRWRNQNVPGRKRNV